MLEVGGIEVAPAENAEILDTYQINSAKVSQLLAKQTMFHIVVNLGLACTTTLIMLNEEFDGVEELELFTFGQEIPKLVLQARG